MCHLPLSVMLLAIVLSGRAVGSTNAPAAAAGPLSLDRAIRLALEHNPGLQAAAARVSAASGRAESARRWTNPELQLQVEDWPVSGAGGFSDAKQTIGVAQTLPFPGKKSLDHQLGRAGVQQSSAELQWRRADLVRDIKVAFYRVLALEQSARVAEQLVDIIGASTTMASRRVEAGAATYQEQLRAEIQLEQARTELSSIHRERLRARHHLAGLLGRGDLTEVELAGDLTETSRSRLAEPASAEALQDHASLVFARANLERAEVASRRARWQASPDVTATVAGGRIGETDQSILQLGFSIPLPLLDPGGGGRLEARAQVTGAEAELRVTEQQLRREWADAHARYRSAAGQVSAYRERILPKAEEALRLVRTGFEQGKFQFIDLVDTQRTAAEARLAYLQRLLDLNVAAAELEALVGENNR